MIILTGFTTAICFSLNRVLKTKTTSCFFPATFEVTVIPTKSHAEDDTHRFTVAFLEGGADDV